MYPIGRQNQVLLHDSRLNNESMNIIGVNASVPYHGNLYAFYLQTQSMQQAFPFYHCQHKNDRVQESMHHLCGLPHICYLMDGCDQHLPKAHHNHLQNCSVT